MAKIDATLTEGDKLAEGDIQHVQLSFSKAWDLADLVASLIAVETEKKEVNEDFNARIKALKKSITKTSAEIQADRKRVT